jgi:type IV secretion system protein VirB9
MRNQAAPAFIAALLCAALPAPHAIAAQLTSPGPLDSRVRSVMYAARDVVTLTGYYGYQMLVQLDPAERIVNLSIGDSVAWQVVPNREGNALFLKPIERNAVTNLTVLTNTRTYLFELRSGVAKGGPRTRGMIYKVEFKYPKGETAIASGSAAAPVEMTATDTNVMTPNDQWNFNYSFSGSKNNRPSRIFDDGKFTYFSWPVAASIPAIFSIDGDKESLINYAVKGQYIVVDRLSARFLLRQGKDVTKINNDGFRAIDAGPDAPKEKSPKVSLWHPSTWPHNPPASRKKQ